MLLVVLMFILPFGFSQTYQDCQDTYDLYIVESNRSRQEYLAQDYMVCVASLDAQAFHADGGLATGASLRSILYWFAPTLTVLLFGQLALGLTRWLPR